MLSMKSCFSLTVGLSKQILSKRNFSHSFFEKVIFIQKRTPVVTYNHNFSGRLIRTCRIMESCGEGCFPEFSKEALKQRLTPQQYQITQEKDTERAFTGKYNKHFEKGTYICIVCSQDLFSSDSKYDSKCGWPAFFDSVSSNSVTFKEDFSHDMKRTEVLCSKCGSHLGHVFDDGPKPTGKRFCINSASLDFRKAEES